MSQRREQWPGPRGRSPVEWRDATRNPQIWLSHRGQQTLIATTLCLDSQLSGHYPSTFDQRWHSPNLVTEDKYPDPGRGSIHTTTIPTVANSNVSKTKSLMSRILYAAPVTSNIIRWDAHRQCLEERSSILFGAVLLRAVRAVTSYCLSPLGELEPLHRERWSGSRLYHVRSCSAQSCLDSFIMLFVPSGRIKAVTRGDCIIFCTLSLISLTCH